MTILEKIKNIIDSEWIFPDEDTPADFNKMIIMAYYFGREEATKEVSDKYTELIKRQRERANNCRYKNMANNVIGDIDYIYFSDYAQEMTKTFGSDLAE